MQVVVIGAGIVGLTTARRLLEAGHRVTVVERAGAPAAGTSGQNGAQLSYAYVTPLASPALWGELPALLWQRDSPLRFTPAGVLGALGWSLRFLWACRAGPAESTTAALLALAELSRRELQRWLPQAPAGAIGHVRNGKLVVYGSAAGFAKARRQLALQARLGSSPQQALGPAECLAAEPALAGADAPIAGGILTPDEEVADCRALCEALAAELQAHPNARLLFGSTAAAFEQRDGRVQALTLRGPGGPQRLALDALVVAAGPQTNAVLAPLGLRLPIAPLKGYSIDIERGALRRFPRRSLTDSARRIVFAPLGAGGRERLRVAGMAELVGDDLGIAPRRIEQLRAAADHWFGLQPGADPVQAPWAGLRPATPSGLPCVGRFGRWANVHANAGHGALGFTLAFGSAALLAASIDRQPAAIDPRPFLGGVLAHV